MKVCRVLVVIVGLMALGAHPGAQDAPKADPVPVLSQDDRALVLDLQARVVGYARAIAVLQKEIDAANADFARLVQKLQAAHPDYELRPDLTYVKKSPPK